MTIMRRSHAKSKTGCVTCKARRVKCDEYWPTCNNCFRGRRTCEYTSRLSRIGRDNPSMLKWPEEEHDDNAEEDKKFIMSDSIKDFLAAPPQEWSHVPRPAIRYIMYMCREKTRLDERGAAPFCCWWNEFEIFIQIASHPAFAFVSHAMIVIAGNRLASLTRSRRILEDVAVYEPRAMQGLRLALAAFSRDNADAVLATSILLLYQQKNWSAWKAMMKGSSSVADQMCPWLKNSPFLSSLRYDEQDLTLGSDINSPLQTTKPMALSDDPRVQVHLRTIPQAESYIFSQAITSLSSLAICTRQQNPEGSATLRALRDLLHIAQSPPPRTPRGWTESEQYRLLYPFAPFSKPLSKSFDAIGPRDPFLLATLAHVYAVTITLALSEFRALNTPTFVPTLVIGIRNIAVAFGKMPVTVNCPGCGTIHRACDLIIFPLNAMRFYQQRTKRDAELK